MSVLVHGSLTSTAEPVVVRRDLADLTRLRPIARVPRSGHSLGVRGIFAVAVLATVAGAAVLGDRLSPVDGSAQQLANRLQAPLGVGPDGVAHLLGTDHLGRDVLARTVSGARVSLLVTLAGVLMAAVIGVTLGLLSGFFGGRIDGAIMTVVDAQLALPFTLVAITMATITGPSVANVLLVLCVTGWVSYARLVRAQTLSLRRREFLLAARGLGCGPGRTFLRHLLPNCLSTVIVVSSFTAAQLMVAEATISFLGVGVPSWIPTWGSMVNEGRSYLAVAWWVVMVPGGALTLTVVAINLFGDWLRDRLDPRLRTR